MRILGVVLFVVYCSVLSYGQTITGYVLDKESGECLIGATVYDVSTFKGTTSNRYGYFTLTVTDTATIVCRYVGYKTQLRKINGSSERYTFQMETQNQLGEVSVVAYQYDNSLTTPEMGLNKLNTKQIMQLPVALGESDVLKTVQMLPGVNMGNEGMAGISVRGGSPDQTLIMLDNVPVYNINHLFGFFSVFNSLAINDVTLIKGAIPARYGGRLSSILDISMKEGNKKEHIQMLEIGTMSGKGSAEGPLFNGKGSYMVSGRRTWLDLPLLAYFLIEESDSRVGYNFWDINGKINVKLSSKDHLYSSFYTGRDVFHVGAYNNKENTRFDYRFSWGNFTSSFRWNHLFSDKLFMNLTLYNSNYIYDKSSESLPQDDSNVDDWKEKHRSSLNDFCLKMEFDYSLNANHRLKFGGNWSNKAFLPESINLNYNDSLLNNRVKKNGNSYFAEFYIEDELSLGEKLKANLGLRSSFKLSGESIDPYLLPRFSFAWNAVEKLSFKAGYSRMVQHLHQLSNSSLAFPTDLWVVSSDSVKSSNSNLFTIGAYFIPNSMYQFSVEVYYSQLQNVVSYFPGVDFTTLDDKHDWYDIVMQGEGKTYGIELMIDKKIGALTGFINYTWSRSFRFFDELSLWGYFPYDYDRPHKLSAMANYEFPSHKGEKYKKSISAAFTFSSGRVMSLATATYPYIAMESISYERYYNPEQVFYNPVPNNVRLSNFHHLDISFHIESVRKGVGSWTFGVYNVYNHFNASYYNVQEDGIKEVTLFPVQPFISWKKKF